MIRPLLMAGVAVAALTLTTVARAQDDANATVKLIQILIEKGILTKGQAVDLLTQARSETRPRAKAATAVTGGAVTGGAVTSGAVTAAPPEAPAVDPGTVRVTYVPQIVRDQLAAEVREQVLGEEQHRGYATPDQIPDWIHRVTVYGDLRARGERDFQDRNNFNQFVDFNSINNGNAFDVNNAAATGFPYTNTTENRTRLRLRGRLGVRAQIDDWIGADIRIATGENNSPVSTNQTLGNNTNFGKYQLWLDRAYAILDAPKALLGAPDRSLKAWIGRTPNPFWTTDLQYSADLNFDGVAVQGAANISSDVRGWVTAGAFPVFNTDFNYSTNQQQKYPSHDKYMFGGQAGVDWKINPEYNAKFSAGLFAYENLQGKLSDPCNVDLGALYTCKTDATRTQFRQFGNTLFALRNNFSNSGSLSNPQYFGLASNYDILDLHGQAQWTKYAPLDVTVEGEFVKNLAFNRQHIVSLGPVNNTGASGDSKQGGPFVGGDTGYFAKVELGTLNVTKLNDWNVFVAYKYLESDAVVDAFTDSNFHLGGTNAKGFILGGDYGLAKNTYVSLRWLSANEVSGPRTRNDVVQFDLNTKF